MLIPQEKIPKISLLIKNIIYLIGSVTIKITAFNATLIGIKVIKT
jgi:hypothetical protein